MKSEEKVNDKLVMLVNNDELSKNNMKKALTIFQWLNTTYPNAHISSMMISHIALMYQRVQENTQITNSNVEYKMPLNEKENFERNIIIKRIKQGTRKEILNGEINYLDVHIRNFIYDNL